MTLTSYHFNRLPDADFCIILIGCQSNEETGRAWEQSVSHRALPQTIKQLWSSCCCLGVLFYLWHISSLKKLQILHRKCFLFLKVWTSSEPSETERSTSSFSFLFLPRYQEEKMGISSGTGGRVGVSEISDGDVVSQSYCWRLSGTRRHLQRWPTYCNYCLFLLDCYGLLK